MLGNSIALIAIAAFFGVEAYKLRQSTAPFITLAVLAVVFALAGFLLPALTDAQPKVGAFVAGVFDDPVAWAALAAVLYFGFRPFWTKRVEPPRPVPTYNAHTRDLEEEISAINQTLVGLEKRLTSELDSFKGSVAGQHESLRMYLQVLEGKITDLKGTSQAQQGALLAIYHRERMLSVASEINTRAMELAVPLAEGKVMDAGEWEAWKSERLQWESSVAHWAQYAAIYAGRDPMADIKRINSEALDEDWAAKAHQFPSDPEGLRIYKTFRIFLRNWANISAVVHERVRRIAFEGAAT